MNLKERANLLKNKNKNNNFIQPANKMLFNTNANSSSDLNNDLKLINNTNHRNKLINIDVKDKLIYNSNYMKENDLYTQEYKKNEELFGILLNKMNNSYNKSKMLNTSNNTNNLYSIKEIILFIKDFCKELDVVCYILNYIIIAVNKNCYSKRFNNIIKEKEAIKEIKLKQENINQIKNNIENEISEVLNKAKNIINNLPNVKENIKLKNVDINNNFKDTTITNNNNNNNNNIKIKDTRNIKNEHNNFIHDKFSIQIDNKKFEDNIKSNYIRKKIINKTKNKLKNFNIKCRYSSKILKTNLLNNNNNNNNNNKDLKNIESNKEVANSRVLDLISLFNNEIFNNLIKKLVNLPSLLNISEIYSIWYILNKYKYLFECNSYIKNFNIIKKNKTYFNDFNYNIAPFIDVNNRHIICSQSKLLNSLYKTKYILYDLLIKCKDITNNSKNNSNLTEKHNILLYKTIKDSFIFNLFKYFFKYNKFNEKINDYINYVNNNIECNIKDIIKFTKMVYSIFITNCKYSFQISLLD